MLISTGCSLSSVVFLFSLRGTPRDLSYPQSLAGSQRALGKCFPQMRFVFVTVAPWITLTLYLFGYHLFHYYCDVDGRHFTKCLKKECRVLPSRGIPGTEQYSPVSE